MTLETHYQCPICYYERTLLYMAHNGHMSMNCIGIDEISCVENMVNQPQNG